MSQGGAQSGAQGAAGQQSQGDGASGSQAGATTTGSGGAQGAATQGAQGAAQGSSGGDDAASTAALNARIAELERENRTYREQRRQSQTAEQQRQAKDATDSERIAQLEKDLQAERTARQEQSLRASVISVATRLGFRNPDMAHRLIDPAAVQYSDAGEPKNVEALLSALAKSDPYLVSAPDFGGGQRGSSAAGGAGQPNMNDLIRQGSRRG